MNIYDLVRNNNKQQDHKLALSAATAQGDTTNYIYSQMLSDTDLFADTLTDDDLCAGDRVALAAENSPEWIIAFLAILKIRCTAVLIDASLPAEDMLAQIEKSDVRCVLASPRAAVKLIDRLPLTLPLLNLSAKGERFRAANVCGISHKATADGDENIAAIIYSSGTTRTAAGIMHTHDALIETTLVCAKVNNLTGNGKYLAVVPNSHIYGLVCTVLAPMLLGADVHFIELSSAEALKKAFAEYRPTIFPCVPKVFELFMTEIERKIGSSPKTQKLFDLFFPVCLSLRKKTGINLGKYLFKSIHNGFGGRIEVLCSAGAPMDIATAEFYLGTGFNMLITYGATETNIPTLGNRGRRLTADSCSRPYPGVSVRIADSGELLIKSPYMMKGYFRDRELTENAFEDGWFKTGDLCTCNARGDYVIIGRCKENIVLATGKKVIPDDVEKKYSRIAGIKEFIVCGVPAAGKSYDEVHAFVVPAAADSLPGLSDAILSHSSTLPASMRITQIHFVEQIPRTSLQKPKRYLLKKLALDENTHTEAALTEAAAAGLEEQVIAVISEVARLDSSRVSLHSRPFSDLGLDSLSAIELALQIEDRFGLRIDHKFSQEMTLLDIIDLLRTPGGSYQTGDRSTCFPQEKRLRDYSLFRNIRALARFVYKITVHNETVIPDNSGFIVCANHVSNFDYLWLTAKFTRKQFEKFCCLAKQEIQNNSRISKRISQVCGIIPVDRANAHIESMICCKKQLQEKWGLLIHPEGTRSENGEMGVFKKGAAVLAIELNVPIIPAYINGAYDVYPKGSRLPRLFNFRKMKKYAVDVAYGNPIFPQGQSPDELILKVKESILALKFSIAEKKT